MTELGAKILDQANQRQKEAGQAVADYEKYLGRELNALEKILYRSAFSRGREVERKRWVEL